MNTSPSASVTTVASTVSGARTSRRCCRPPSPTSRRASASPSSVAIHTAPSAVAPFGWAKCSGRSVGERLSWIQNRKPSSGDWQVGQAARVAERIAAGAQRGVQGGRVARVERQERRPVAGADHVRVLRRQRVDGRRHRQQLDARAVRELHVRVADPVRVRPARLEGEAERPIRRRRRLQVAHGDRDVVEPDAYRFLRRRRQRQDHREQREGAPPGHRLHVGAPAPLCPATWRRARTAGCGC